jgi:hypothetical protein
MLKPERVTNAMLRKILQRAFYASADKDGWLTVQEGLPCIVNMQVDVERKVVRFYAWYRLAHMKEADIATTSCRLNLESFLVKFVAAKDHINMFYSLPCGEGLNAATLIRSMRTFAKVTADAIATVPKTLVDMRPEAKPQQPHLRLVVSERVDP